MQLKTRKFIFIIICFAIFSSFLLLLTANFSATAQNETDYHAKQFNKPDGYYFFDSPSAVFANEDSLFVAQNNKIDIFSLSNNTKTDTAFKFKPQKLAESNGKYITLANNELKIDDTIIIGKFKDFSLFDGFIFAIKEDNSIFKYSVADPSVNEQILITPASYKKIAVADSKIYLTQANISNSNFDDILMFSFNDSAWSQTASVKLVNKSIELNVLSSGFILSHTNSGLASFSQSADTLKLENSLQNTDITQICVNSTAIFALTNVSSIIKIDYALQTTETLYSSASSEAGYFYMPCAVASRKGNIAIADEFNNRAVIYSNGKVVKNIELNRPKSIAIDNSGNYFIANNINEISKFTDTFFNETDAKLTAPSGVNIKSIKFNSNNDLYVLSSAGVLYKVDCCSASFEVQNTSQNQKIVAFNIALDSDIVYIATTDNIYELESQTPIVTTAGISDFCIDHDGAIYVLTSANVCKFTAGVKDESLPNIVGVTLGAMSITMNTATNTAYDLQYGDLIITDTLTHSVKIIGAQALEVNKNFKMEDTAKFPDTTTPPILTDAQPQIIYTLKNNASVYALQAEVTPTAYLNKNMSVIIPDFDKTKKFNFIIADNITTQKDAPPIFGYVFTSDINIDPLEYTSNHPKTAYTYIENVSIYAFPTKNSPKYADYKNLKKDTKLTLLDFCYTAEKETTTYGYADNFPSSTTWYKVAFSEHNYVGYVTKDFISIRGANPDLTIYPQINATIKSKDKNNSSVGALCYNKNSDGTFTVIEDLEPLAVGTKIEVIGAFDTTKDYTKIKFLTKYGTVEVYVDTLNVDYDGVNVVQVVAIILIILTLILLAIIVWRVVYIKQHK